MKKGRIISDERLGVFFSSCILFIGFILLLSKDSGIFNNDLSLNILTALVLVIAYLCAFIPLGAGFYFIIRCLTAYFPKIGKYIGIFLFLMACLLQFGIGIWSFGSPSNTADYAVKYAPVNDITYDKIVIECSYLTEINDCSNYIRINKPFFVKSDKVDHLYIRYSKTNIDDIKCIINPSIGKIITITTIVIITISIISMGLIVLKKNNNQKRR